MAWQYGIPDVSFTNHFVYFQDLLTSNTNNTFLGLSRKREVGRQAQSAFNSAINQLDNSQMEIDEAVTFIQAAAENERKKEIAAVESYYKKIGEAVPSFKNFFDKNNILIDPEGFYTKLTTEINKTRRTMQEYKDELQRILANSQGAKTKLADYFKDDYRYRISGDVSSMLKKMIGTFKENKNTEKTYAQEIQEIALEITKEIVGDKLNKGEDFAAIASAVLIELESRAQKLIDHPKDGENYNDFVKLKGEMLQTLKENYLKELESSNQKEKSAVQIALTDINSEDFLRITKNVKSILGIETLETDSKEYKKQRDLISKKAKQRSNDTKNARRAVSNIKKILGNNLAEKMYTLKFTKMDNNSAHGNLFELVKTLVEENGIKAGRYAATDVLSIACNLEVKPNDKFINDILEEIGAEMSSVLENEQKKEGANEKDLRDSIDKMNKNIESAIQKLDSKIKELNNNDIGEFFVFHESLKLYSSIETGVYKKWGGHEGFSGRTMNILSYIDFMLSALSTAGLSSPLDRDTLIFLGLNLSDAAVGQGSSEPLTKYFSIFAGLLMFDDIANMAKEAIGAIPESSVKQVHLYNLNGVYVPASMILSYVSDALQLGASEASYAATVSINSNAASGAINDWTIKWSETNNHPILGPNEWNEMGSAVASGTQVRIAFMGAFIHFINMLAEV